MLYGFELTEIVGLPLTGELLWILGRFTCWLSCESIEEFTRLRPLFLFLVGLTLFCGVTLLKEYFLPVAFSL